ncbi:MAG TPA: PEP-CTERM sorting domain-containing protein [Lacunisphaera sp.]
MAVTSITTSTTDQSNQNVNGTTFERTTTAVSTFNDSAGNIYDANTVAGSAFVRRNTTAGNDNNASVWYDQGSNASKFSATYATSYSSLLLGNNILRGSDNTFANGTDASSGNIERLDFLFSNAGLTASTQTSFAIFDRGLATEHDYVKIAVITGWDSVNNVPTAYGGNLVSVTTANYGTTNPIGNFDYNLFRYDNGDNLGSPYWNSNSETGMQGIGGVVISMADLGIASGTTIYGYSLMGYDVTAGGNMANLVDWTNTTYYAADTTGSTGTGGIDLSAVNGVLYNRRVPEPSTYGAIFMTLTAGFLGWRRFRRAVNAPAV